MGLERVFRYESERCVITGLVRTLESPFMYFTVTIAFAACGKALFIRRTMYDGTLI
jgi:hypothetical protein